MLSIGCGGVGRRPTDRRVPAGGRGTFRSLVFVQLPASAARVSGAPAARHHRLPLGERRPSAGVVATADRRGGCGRGLPSTLYVHVGPLSAASVSDGGLAANSRPRGAPATAGLLRHRVDKRRRRLSGGDWAARRTDAGAICRLDSTLNGSSFHAPVYNQTSHSDALSRKKSTISVETQ